MKCSHHKIPLEKKKRRKALLLNGKNIIYCSNYCTALQSAIKIFNTTEDIVQNFVDSKNSLEFGSRSEDVLLEFLSYIGSDNIPTYDGTIFFHATRVEKNELFHSGLLPFDRLGFFNRISKILKKGRAFDDLHLLQESGVMNPYRMDRSQSGPCGFMFENSIDNGDYNYHAFPEILFDMIALAPEGKRERIKYAFFNRTVSKTVEFFIKSDRDSLHNARLGSLICYLWIARRLPESIGYMSEFDVGIEGEGTVVRFKDIINIKLKTNISYFDIF